MEREQLEAPTGKKMPLTSFKIQLNSIGSINPASAPSARDCDEMGEGHELAVPRRNESKHFSMQDEVDDKEDHYEIHRDIEIPVVYPHGMLWKDLEPITIQVLSYPDDDDTQQGALSDLSRQMSSTPKRGVAVSVTADVVDLEMAGGTPVYPGAKTLYGKHHTIALSVFTSVNGMPTAVLRGHRHVATLNPCCNTHVCRGTANGAQIDRAAAHFRVPLPHAGREDRSWSS